MNLEEFENIPSPGEIEEEESDFLNGIMETGPTGTNQDETEQNETAVTGTAETAATGQGTPDDPSGETMGVTQPTAPTGTTETGVTGTTAATGSTGPESPTGPTGVSEDDVWKLSDDDTTKPKEGTVDYKNMASRIGIEFDGDNEEAFIESVKTAIADSTNKTELDLSKYNEETRALINLIEEPGVDLLEVISPITNIDQYLMNHTPEEIMTDYLIKENKLSITDARSKIAEMVNDESFDDEYKKVQQIFADGKREILQDRIQSISEANQSRKTSETTQTQTERKNMVTALEGMDEFMGLKIPPGVKQTLAKQINSGVFTESNNNARTQVNARLFELFGNKVMELHQAKLEEEKRKSYNEGLKNIKSDLHNTQPKKEGAEAVDTSKTASRGDTSPIENFEGFEDEISPDAED